MINEGSMIAKKFKIEKEFKFRMLNYFKSKFILKKIKKLKK